MIKGANKMDKDINIILNEKDGRIDLLYNGYNIIAETIYNKELTQKITDLLDTELRNNSINYNGLYKY